MPRPTPEEFAGRKASIKRIGVRMPIVLWKNPQTGTIEIIDGATRQKAVEELLAEGVKMTDNGLKLELPTWEYKGAALGALDYSLAMNRDRRNLSSGQLAAVTIQAGALQARYEAKTRSSEERSVGDLAGDMAEKLSKETGTNRDYLFKCQAIQNVAPDLLDKVKAGEVSVVDAYREIRPTGPVAPPTRPKPKPAEVEAVGVTGMPAVLDGLGNVIEVPDMAAAFATVSVVKRIQDDIKQTRAAILALGSAKGGAHIPYKAMAADLAGLIRTLRETIPHTTCPYCKGLKKDKARKACRNCDGAGYMTILQYKLVPDAEK